jgi:transcriptional regulator with XRE-family HTH domain
MTKQEILAIRTSLRMTQEQLAQLLGVHSLTISKWERGLLQPSAHQEALLRVAAGAVEHRPDIGPVVAAALIGAGIGVALFHLLRAAFDAPHQGPPTEAGGPPAPGTRQ